MTQQDLPEVVLQRQDLGAQSGDCAAGTTSALAIVVVSLSLTMIVRNEAQFIKRCLDSIRGHVDELIVVDTGSTDETVAIAEREGARVFHHVWDNDFSAARNAALKHATGQWVLLLDADELVAPLEPGKLREFVATTDADCGLLRIHDATRLDTSALEVLSGTARHGDPLRVPRLFRNTDGLSFNGQIHEEATAWLHRRGMKVGFVPADIIHYGRVASVVTERGKAARNHALLQQWAVRDRADYSACAFLGCELIEAGKVEEARTYLEDGWRRFLAGGAPPYRSALRLGVGRAILGLIDGDFAVALESLQKVEANEGLHPDLSFLRGQVHEQRALLERGQLRKAALAAATANFEQAIKLQSTEYAQRFVPGSSGKEAFTHLGTVRMLAHKLDEAKDAFLQAMRLAPEDVDARLGFLEADIRAGRPERALEDLAPLLPVAFDAWLLTAMAAHSMGATNDFISILDATQTQERSYRAPHRRELHLDLLTFRSFYERRPVSTEGGVGRLLAIALRSPFLGRVAKPIPASEAGLDAFARNLIALGNFNALDAFFERRAEVLVSGSKATVLSVLERAGYRVENAGQLEPALLLTLADEDREFCSALLTQHPNIAAHHFASPDSAKLPPSNATRELVCCTVKPAELRDWLESFPNSQALIVGAFPASTELPAGVEQRCLTFTCPELLSAPDQALNRIFAFLGEPENEAPLRYAIERYPTASVEAHP